MYYSNEKQMRARYNMQALRPAGIPVERAYQEADRYAADDVSILGFEYRDDKLFLKLCPDHEHGQPYEAELHIGRHVA